MYMICEQNYFNFVEWRNDHNKSCSSWEVMKICNWNFFIWINLLLQNLISIYGKHNFPIGQKKGSRQTTSLSWAALGKIAGCRRPRKAHGKLHLCREPLSAKLCCHEALYLPWVLIFAVGKKLVCREPDKKTHGKTLGSRQLCDFR
jgi:hypothetical protein